MERFTLATTLLLASCALPSNVTIANRVTLDGPTAAFQACGVSVRFSGTPRTLQAHEAAQYTMGLSSTPRKWQVDGLLYQEFSFSQTALCVCGDAEFSNTDISNTERALARNENVKMLPVEPRRFARKTIGVEAPYTAGGDFVGDQALFLFPAKARRCTFVQGGRFAPTAPTALKTFFATLEPIGK